MKRAGPRTRAWARCHGRPWRTWPLRQRDRQPHRQNRTGEGLGGMTAHQGPVGRDEDAGHVVQRGRGRVDWRGFGSVKKRKMKAMAT